MRTFARRLVPALVLPIALLGLTPGQEAMAETGADRTPTVAEVGRLLDTAPASLVPDTVLLPQASSQAAVSGGVIVPGVASRPVQMGQPQAGLRVGLPSETAAAAVVRDGVSIYEDDARQASYAVNPLADGGAQFLVAIGGPESPEEYRFPIAVPAGARLRLTDDGGAEVQRANGELLASMPPPWAYDALGRPVPTHFDLVDGALVQVVRHVTAAHEYPILADPTIFHCDAWTASCVKFSKAETVTISRWGSPGIVGAGIWAASVCSKIPVAVLVVPCTLYVGMYAYLLSRSFDSAAGSGKCVEMHFSRIGAPFWWKTESC